MIQTGCFLKLGGEVDDNKSSKIADIKGVGIISNLLD